MQGSIDCQLLCQSSRFGQGVETAHIHHHSSAAQPSAALVAPQQGALRVNNRGEGYFSRGWLCAASQHFDYQTCQRLFKALRVERLKAVVITDKGTIGFNVADGMYQENCLNEAEDTRIELITSSEKLADQVAEIIECELGLTD